YFWLAARLAWQGAAGQVYDIDAFTRSMRQLLPYMPVGQYAFAYPPPFLLLVLPLGALSLPAAFLAWIAASLAAFAASLYAIFPRRAVLLAAVLAPGFTLNLWFGQTGLLCGALIGLAFALAPARPWLAGVALGLLVLKPHLAAAVAVVFLFGGRWATLAGA